MGIWSSRVQIYSLFAMQPASALLFALVVVFGSLGRLSELKWKIGIADADDIKLLGISDAFLTRPIYNIKKVLAPLIVEMFTIRIRTLCLREAISDLNDNG